MITLNYSGRPTMATTFTKQPGLVSWEDSSYGNDELASATFVYEDGSAMLLFVGPDDPDHYQRSEEGWPKYTAYFFRPAVVDQFWADAGEIYAADWDTRHMLAYKMVTSGVEDITVEGDAAMPILHELSRERRR